MTKSADQDQLASEANWSGSPLFAKKEHVVFSKRRVNTNCSVKSNKFYQGRPWRIWTLKNHKTLSEYLWLSCLSTVQDGINVVCHSQPQHFQITLCPATRQWRRIMVYPPVSVRSSVRQTVRTSFLDKSSYSFNQFALKLGGQIDNQVEQSIWF